MKKTTMITIFCMVLLIIGVYADSSISGNFNVEGDLYTGGNINATNLTIQQELRIVSGNTFWLNWMYIKNFGLWSEIDHSLVIFEDKQPTVFVGVENDNESIWAHSTFFLDVLNSTTQWIKTGSRHPFSPNTAGITNEDGNFGLFVENDRSIAMSGFTNVTKDENKLITYMYGINPWSRINGSLFELYHHDMIVNGSALIDGDLNVTGTSYLGDVTLTSNNITVNNIISKDENISFYNSSESETVRITNDGNVGIGTTNPDWPLHLFRNDDHAMLELEANGSNHGEANLYFKTQSASFGWQIFMDDSSLNDLGDANKLGFFHGSSNTMVLDGNSGNVGIGTISPLSTLHISGTGTIITGDFNSYLNLTETSLIVETDTDTSYLASHNGTERQKMEFHAKEYELETGESGNRNYFVMDTNGKIGIGTTTPTERLTIDVKENNFGGLEVTNSDTDTNAQSSLILRTVDNTTAFGQDGTFGWLLTARKSNFASTDLQEDLLFTYRDGTSWNNIMFLEHDTGNVGIGMPSPSTTLSVNGNAYMDGDLNISGTFNGDGSGLTGAGWSGYEIISVTTGSSSENKAQSAWCSSGKNVTGGGCSISDSNTNLTTQKSYPRSGSEWRCRGVEINPVATSWSLTVYAICGNV